MKFFTEQNIALLERHWVELRNEARAETTEKGWLVTLSPNAPTFLQAGFRHGETISAPDLLKHAHTSGQKALAERLLAVLEHIAAVAPVMGHPADTAASVGVSD